MENTTYLIKTVKVKATQSSFPDINSNTVNSKVNEMTWEELNEALEYMFNEFKNTVAMFGFKSIVMTFDYIDTKAPDHIRAIDFGFDEEGVVCCS
jgi:hypothetical protein